MVELHGWITLRETSRVSIDEEENSCVLIEEIISEIDKLSWFKPEVNAQNGEWFIEFTIFCNRINPQVEEAFRLFEKIGQIAKGSYGLIYLYNDEDTQGKNNIFQVFSMVRGKIYEKEDPFLSPIIPVLEDTDED